MASPIEVFVPGRLCVLGEHTDWAAEYSSENPAIGKGNQPVMSTRRILSLKQMLVLQGIHWYAQRTRAYMLE